MNLAFLTINFFILVSIIDAKWYYNMPIFLINIFYALVINYEIKTYCDAADFLSMFETVQDRFILSKLSLILTA